MHVFGWFLCVTLGIACAIVYFTGEKRVSELEAWLASAPAQQQTFQDEQREAHLKRLTELRAKVNTQIDTSIEAKTELANTTAKVEAETAFLAQSSEEDGPLQEINTLADETLDIQAQVELLRRRDEMRQLR